MNTPTVSIVVPCYNASQWLAQTLDSAFAQTWPALEVIVVDDGSRDDSVDIARRYERRGLRLLTQPNRGAGAARNAGAAVATGAYIQFLDADDLLAPDKLALQVRCLERNPGCIASCEWARFVDDPAQARWPRRSLYRDFQPIEFLIATATTDAVMAPVAWLTPRDVVERAGPWDEGRAPNDDAEYFARVVLASSGVVFCPGGRSYYRSFRLGTLSHQRKLPARRERFRATALVASHMLAAEDSARVRSACAHLFRSYIRRMYPEPADLIAEAEARIRQLAGPGAVPGRPWKEFQRLRMALRRRLVAVRRSARALLERRR